MRIASCLFTLCVLLAGCGGEEATPGPGPTSAPDPTSTPVVVEVEPTPGAAEQAVSDATRLTVLFTNNIDGEIEPCG